MYINCVKLVTASFDKSIAEKVSSKMYILFVFNTPTPPPVLSVNSICPTLIAPPITVPCVNVTLAGLGLFLSVAITLFVITFPDTLKSPFTFVSLSNLYPPLAKVNIIISASAPNNNLHLFLALFLIFVLVALIYIIVGGFKAVVATDKVQLSLGFISISLFIVLTYIKVINNGYLYTGLILFLLSFSSLLFLNVLYGKFKDINSEIFPKRLSPTLFISLAIFVLGGIIITYNIFRGIDIKDSFYFFLREQKCGKVFSLGLLPMLSLLLANGLWQIVDISNWQRLASLDYSDDTQIILSKTLSFISWYSPITWLLAIFFGMSLRYTGFDVPDAWTALQKLAYDSFQSKNIIDNIYILIFIFGMISIMYSTLDSLISSISYTTYYDIILKGNIDEAGKLSRARLWTIVYTAIFFVIYLLVRSFVEGVDKILYTFYSFQLALFPAIISVFINKKINVLSAYMSIIFGGFFCLIPLFIDTETINPYSASAIFSVVGSIIVYAIFSFNSKYNISNI